MPSLFCCAHEDGRCIDARVKCDLCDMEGYPISARRRLKRLPDGTVQDIDDEQTFRVKRTKTAAEALLVPVFGEGGSDDDGVDPPDGVGAPLEVEASNGEDCAVSEDDEDPDDTAKRDTIYWLHNFSKIQENIPDHLRVAISEEEFVRGYKGKGARKYVISVVDRSTGEKFEKTLASLLNRKKILDMDEEGRRAHIMRKREKTKQSVLSRRNAGNVRDECRRAFLHVKHHHRKGEEAFDLTVKDVYKMLDAQNGVCALSGIRFDTKRDHLRPSIDAMDPSKGHRADNCHLVLKVVNYAKNSLTIRQFQDVLDGKRCIAYERPNNAKSKEVWEVIDPTLPLNMTPRQTFVWKAMASLPDQTPVSRLTIQQYINENLCPQFDFDKQQTHISLNKFVSEGYIEKLADGKRNVRYLAKGQPLPHPTLCCGACKAELPLSQLQSRPNRAYGFAPLNGNLRATNQTRNICRNCRTNYTTKCRNRDRASYVWSKICSRMHGRKDGDIEKEDLVSMCEVEVCPIAGISLSYESSWSPNQASPDRIDNDKGYTKENVRIVSLLANYARHRSELSDDDLRAILSAVRERAVDIK